MTTPTKSRHSLWLLLSLAASLGSADAYCAKYATAAKDAAANLQSAYFVNGGYGSQQVWINAVDGFHLRKLDTVTSSSTYSDVINTIFVGHEGQLDNDQSFDDVQWVAIAYLQAGNIAQAQKYYGIASTGVDSTVCGGGLFWNGKRTYKNAITNELYMTSSGYMYDVLKDEQYLNNLKNTWSWLKASGMRGSNGLFNDGLTDQCANNGQTQWTYNQGALLAGLGYLYKYTQDAQVLADAWSIIDSIIASSTWDGGLREPCETTSDNGCNADQQTFKGITMQYIAWFLEVSGRDNNGKYSTFVKTQADKILQFAVGPPGFYSNLWYGVNGGSAVWTASSQASALGGLVAAAAQTC